MHGPGPGPGPRPGTRTRDPGPGTGTRDPGIGPGTGTRAHMDGHLCRDPNWIWIWIYQVWDSIPYPVIRGGDVQLSCYLLYLREYTYVPHGSGIVYITITRVACSRAKDCHREGPRCPKAPIGASVAATCKN